MYVYQLKILDLGIYLEPVFKSKESALYYMSRYQNRNIIIKEKYLDSIEDNSIYRIKTNSIDGELIEDGVYSNFKSALKYIKSDNQTVIKESLHF